MAFTPPSKPPAKPVDAAAAFIAGAPDAGATPPKARKGVRKGNKDQITHAFKPEVLQQLDEFAAKNGLKRAGAIDLAVLQLLRHGIQLQGSGE